MNILSIFWFEWLEDRQEAWADVPASENVNLLQKGKEIACSPIQSGPQWEQHLQGFPVDIFWRIELL